MPDATADRSQLVYHKQAAFGESPPAAPTVEALRYTADTFKSATTSVESNEIRNDRMRTERLLTGYAISGGFALELSDGTYDPFLESLLGGVFTTGVLKNGGLPQTYFMIERGLLDVSKYILFRDCAPTQLNLTVPSRGIVTGDFGFMGTVGDIASASFVGAGTVTPPSTTHIMSAGPGINNILVNAAAIGVGVQEIRLTLNAGLRERAVVDSLLSREFGLGEIQVTGSLKMYFSDDALYQIFLANDVFSLAFTISDNKAHAYDFVLPNCQPTDDDAPVPAIDTDVIETFAFKAYRDPASSSLIHITKRALP